MLLFAGDDARNVGDHDQMKGIRMKRTALLATLLSVATTSAHADPGHGMAASLTHLLTEPDHVLILAALAFAVWYGFRRLRARI